MSKRSVQMNFNEMPPGKLGVYIMDIQHPYLLKALRTFNICTTKIAETKEKEGDSNILADTLSKLGGIIEQHLTWEEEVFFPYLRLKIANREPVVSSDLPAMLKKMRSEHYTISRLIRKVRLISNGYTPASEASPTLRLCYAQLFDFEQDMLKHFFLEDDILFPKLFNQ